MNVELMEMTGDEKPQVIFENRIFFVPKKIQKQIEKHWENTLSQGKNFSRGEVFCVEDIEKKANGAVQMKLVKSDYAHYLATIDRAIPKAYYCKALYSGVILKTRDEYFAFGKMAAHTSLPGQVQCAGGGLDKKYVGESGVCDVRENAAAELREEMYLDAKNPRHISSFSLHFIKTGGWFGTVGMMFFAETPFSKKELQKHFLLHSAKEAAIGRKPEFDEIIFVSATKEGAKKFFTEEKYKGNDYMKTLLEKLCTV